MFFFVRILTITPLKTKQYFLFPPTPPRYSPATGAIFAL
jgi:hypothetical protein